MKIETRDLFFTYGGNALIEGISVTLEPGRFTMLLGPNGGGKSTLLRLLTGELVPVSGSVELDGRPVRDYPGLARARRLGVVLQSAPPALDLTVREYVLTGRSPRMSPLMPPKPADLDAVENAMRLFGVDHLAERCCNRLSGGERQRVMLAAAWAVEPEIFLLDEATSAADPAHTFAVLKIFRECARTRTVFMVTHDLIPAANFADRILLLKDGRIYADGTPDQVLTEANLFAVYGLYASVSRTPDGTLAILPGKEYL